MNAFIYFYYEQNLSKASISQDRTMTNKLLLILFSLAILTTANTQDSPVRLPKKFDLRDVDGKNYVSAIKQQMGGTCWTHGAMAAIESNLMITGLWNMVEDTTIDSLKEPNLAEYHLDWWNGFNEHNNDDVDSIHGLEVHYGGDYRVVSAYLSRLEGALRDVDAQSYDEPPQRFCDSGHYYHVRNIEWYVVGDNLEHIDTIKHKIMTHGAMGTCLNVGYTDYETHTHYQPDSTTIEPNHAVAIIGWDDEKETLAEKPGAWLCKNSYGPNSQIAGCFWMSYYDKHGGGHHPEMGAISFQNTDTLAFNNVYYHDFHGWRDTKPNCREAFNAFVAEQNGELRAVSFYTAVDNVTYDVAVYDSFSNGELAVKCTEMSGTIIHTGLHTIDLTTPVSLEKDDDFYICLKLSTGGHPYDRTSEVPVLLGWKNPNIVLSSAKKGQSYYREIGSDVWKDFYDYDDPSGYLNTGNFCIKGLTVDEIIVNISPSNRKVNQGRLSLSSYPNPFISHTTIAYTLASKSEVTLEIYNTRGKRVHLLAKDQLRGNHTVTWNGTDMDGKLLAGGMYYFVLTIETLGRKIIENQRVLMVR